MFWWNLQPCSLFIALHIKWWVNILSRSPKHTLKYSKYTVLTKSETVFSMYFQCLPSISVTKYLRMINTTSSPGRPSSYNMHKRCYTVENKLHHNDMMQVHNRLFGLHYESKQLSLSKDKLRLKIGQMTMCGRLGMRKKYSWYRNLFWFEIRITQYNQTNSTFQVKNNFSLLLFGCIFVLFHTNSTFCINNFLCKSVNMVSEDQVKQRGKYQYFLIEKLHL